VTPPPERLDVYFGAERVGSIHDASPLAFEYSPQWLARPERMTIAAIPLASGRNDAPAVAAYFENLLPEGELRRYLMEQRKASGLFSLLREVAGDTVGGFVIVLPDELPRPPVYEETSWAALAAILRKPSAAAIDLQESGARISLAGVQDKLSVALFGDDVPHLPKGASPSTHIVKPDIRRLNKVWHSAANEAFVMRTALHCGLPTAEVFYERHTGSCVVTRFDRIVHADRTIERLVQYDICQLAGTTSERKYEKEGGPGVVACAAVIRRYSSRPAVDLRHFVDWIFFNLYAGNNDGHAKNLSIHRRDGGVVLAPFYDLMSTRAYAGLSQEFAFAIGDEVRPGRLTGEHLAALATRLGMNRRYLARQASELAERLPAALAEAASELSPALSPSARTMVERLRKDIGSTARKMAARLTS
jgi:serine/threonine-protein kinase HipA